MKFSPLMSPSLSHVNQFTRAIWVLCLWARDQNYGKPQFPLILTIQLLKKKQSNLKKNFQSTFLPNYMTSVTKLMRVVTTTTLRLMESQETIDGFISQRLLLPILIMRVRATEDILEITCESCTESAKRQCDILVRCRGVPTANQSLPHFHIYGFHHSIQS
mmetsp:Transcript_35882/g.100964  ORF Transcript_35882/g.100964 Transcript_35882/m.100964 type:complete len:161 (+) Transcript_35882:588-1070(+)